MKSQLEQAGFMFGVGPLDFGLSIFEFLILGRYLSHGGILSANPNAWPRWGLSGPYEMTNWTGQFHFLGVLAPRLFTIGRRNSLYNDNLRLPIKSKHQIWIVLDQVPKYPVLFQGSHSKGHIHAGQRPPCINR